jgi:hypothetical protein
VPRKSRAYVHTHTQARWRIDQEISSSRLMMTSTAGEACWSERAGRWFIRFSDVYRLLELFWSLFGVLQIINNRWEIIKMPLGVEDGQAPRSSVRVPGSWPLLLSPLEGPAGVPHAHKNNRKIINN